MARISRRSVLAAAGASAAASAARAAGVSSAAKNKLIFISDVHIGDNSPTVWYQQRYHEPYLKAIFDYVNANAGSIRELIILGDFVDFWTYPPDVRPPGFAAIAAANPGVFGPAGMLNQALDALGGKVSYLPGNHDMGVRQSDLDTVGGRRKVRLLDQELYFPLGADRSIVCAHGHGYTMFNAPDPTTRLAPLPIGHFITRSYCHMLARTLKPGQTVADLANQGAPDSIDLGGLVKSLDFDSVIDTVVNYASNEMRMKLDEPIVLPSGDTTTLGEVKTIYNKLWHNWIEWGGGGDAGELIAKKVALADMLNGTYLPWFAQKMALENDASLVVMGHTHVPVRGLENAFVDYVNTGFDCASMPDMAKRHATFIELDTFTLQAQIMQVTGDGAGGYAVAPFDGARRETIVYSPNFDFSTYVAIDNSGGAGDLVRADYSAKEGYFVVPPPARVARGEKARFWIQDEPGGNGSSGTATYANAGASLTLKFGCPTGVKANNASGADFRSRYPGRELGPLNDVAKFGHPFFVEFLA